MPVQARRVQIVVARDLTARLAGRQPAVNLGALDMLTRTAFPHDTYTYSPKSSTNRAARPTMC